MRVKVEMGLDFTGTWYDGSSWSDGVPYMDGNVTVHVDGKRYAHDARSSSEWSEHYNEAIDAAAKRFKVDLDYLMDEGYDELMDIVEKKSPDGRVFAVESVEFESTSDPRKPFRVKNVKFMNPREYEKWLADYEDDADESRKIPPFDSFRVDEGINGANVSKLADAITKDIYRIDDSMSYLDFAMAVARVLKEEYGTHLYKDFVNALSSNLRT